MINKELIEAYLATSYCVFTPGGTITLRIGVANPELDSLLDEEGTYSWAFLTAWNPGSRQLSATENEVRHATLERRLEALGFARLPGVGQPHDNEWAPEESIFVFGIDRTIARSIGREFGQNAIVVGNRRAPAELVVCAEGEER